LLDGERRGVSPEAEVGGVPERRHAAGAHHELQAGREQREDEDVRSRAPGDTRRRSTADTAPRRNRRAREGRAAARRHDERTEFGERCVGGADGTVPISPYGLTTSTIAMTTNSATSVIFGNAIECPRCPRAERDAQRLREADQERRDEGAGDRAQAAGDGDDERLPR
jgi:hypothetical protein